ncbi:MAG: caspase family protein [Hormoscilla sp.]
MNRQALIVGINEYPNYLDKNEKPLNLQKAMKDAVDIAKMLKKYGGFKVQLVLDQNYNPFWVRSRGLTKDISGIKPESESLKQAIERLFSKGSESPEGNDTALLYFAGHGEEARGDKDGFLVTSDSDGKSIGGISFKWLREVLLNSPVRQKLVWLDCCYSGDFLNFDKGDTDEQQTCLITASRSFETAVEKKGGDHGLLTEALLEALDPRKKTEEENPWVTSVDLVAYVQKKLTDERQRPCHINSNKPIFITGARKEEFTEKIAEETLKDTCPYQGLKPFEVGDAKNFHGREGLVQELLDGLNNEDRFLAVLGASGSGKSSLVKAGLVHKLQEQQRSGGDKWNIVIFRPGKNPLESLVRALGKGEAFEKDPDRFHFDKDLTLARLVGGPNSELRTPNSELVPVLVVVDQFEEVFTLCQGRKKQPVPKKRSPGENAVLEKKLSPEKKAALQKELSLELREQFIGCLLGAKEAKEKSGIDLKVVITMRADFLGHCVEYAYSGLAQKIQNNLVLVGPMGKTELSQAIKKPAEDAGAHVDLQLVERMLDEVQGPGSLPLLQYTLWVMWNNPSNYRLLANSLALSDYVELGGVKGTLSARADEVYDKLDDQAAAKRIFMNLIQINENAEDTRKQAFKSDLINDRYKEEVIDATLDRLVGERLLVTDEKEGETTVDVAHEALIRHWDKLQGWVNESREALISKNKIESEFREWSDKGKSDAHLLSPGKLYEVEDYKQQYNEWGGLSKEVNEYILKSHERQEKQKEQMTLPVMQLNVPKVQELLKSKPVKALVLAIKTAGLNLGLERSKGGLEDYVQLSLFNPIREVREINMFKGHENYVLSVAFSPDGKRIVSGSSDETIRLWDLDGNPIGEPFRGHENSVLSVAFSPDGKRIVSGSNDLTIRLWDLDGKPIGEPFRGHENSVESVAFSPDGKRIVSGSYDKTIRLWPGDNWRDPLTLGCNLLWLHPVLAGPDVEEGVNVSRRYVWDKAWDDKDKARFLVRQGWLLVSEKGDVSGAVAKFEEAYGLDGDFDLEGAKRLAAQLVKT